MASPSEFHDREIAASYLAAADFRVYDNDGGEEEDDEEYVTFSPPSSRVLPDLHLSPTYDFFEGITIPDWEPLFYAQEDGNKRRRTDEGEGSSSPIGSQGNELSDTDIDGFICPICFDVWTSGGEHQIWYHLKTFSIEQFWHVHCEFLLLSMLLLCYMWTM